MFNNSSHLDASHSTFSEVHRDQYFTSRTNVQGNQSINTIVHGNQIVQASQIGLEALHKASAPSAAFDSAERHPAPRCLQGTRIELLGRLSRWANSEDECDNDTPICWLYGRPGSGKSAVSQSIAETFSDQKRLAASFFFSRRDIERCTTRHFFSTIATQFLSSIPAIRPALQATLDKDGMIPSKVLREQMQKLLLEPLSSGLIHTGPPLLILIDALEECDDPRLVVELVSLLIQLIRKSPLPLRLLITSRQESWLQTHFRRPDVAPIVFTLDMQSFSVDEDIKRFLEYALEEVRQEHAHIMPDEPWPSPEDLDRIIDKSSGLFIFALTVVKFVGDRFHNPVQRLQAILEDTPSRDTTYSDLDALYLDAVSTFPDADTARLILGTVYCLFVPITALALHHLLDRQNVDVRIVIPALGSVLLSSDDGEQPVQFYHTSFRDFLVSPQRSRKYTIDPVVYHRLMAQLCFQTMVRSLERDMCGLDDPSKLNRGIQDLPKRREEAYGEALLYACRYWSYHLTELPTKGGIYESLLDAMHEFCSKVLLYWIEMASIFDDIDDTIIMLRDALDWLKSLAPIPKETATLVEDAERLVLLFRQPISQSAPHVYHTAITFSPSSSALYTCFKHDAGGVFTIDHGQDDEWQAYRYAIDLGSKITSVAFSPGGDLVATAGTNQGVQLWNVATGGIVASFGGRASSVLVRFAGSGDFFAAAFEDGTIAVWDPDLGQEYLEDRDPHTDDITCLEFSPDSSLLASGARDHTIQLWSLDSLERLFRLVAHEGPVTVLAFMPDSQRLCSGSEDNLIIIWNLESGKVVRGMMGHSAALTSLDVSCDGTIVVSGSQDKTVKVWEVRSGNCMRTLSKGHSHPIRSVHFFDDDTRFLSASDGTILASTVSARKPSDTSVWDLGQNVQATMNNAPVWQAKLLGRGLPTFLLRKMMEIDIDESSGEQLLVAYSPRSSSFAFSYLAESWSAPFGSKVKSPSIHVSQAYLTSLALSPDGTRIATGNFIGTLDILDTTLPARSWEEEMKRDLAVPLRSASIVVPSPNGSRFLVNSGLSWYLADSRFHLLSKIDFGIADYARTDDVPRPIFSADSSAFAWSLSDILERRNHTTVRVYDSRTAMQTVRFQGLKKIQAFVVSPNGDLIGCGHDGALVVCEVGKKAKRAMNVAVDASITALTFSNNSETLLSGSKSGVLQLWDLSSGACTATFSHDAFNSPAMVVGFAPSRDMVAVAHKDGAVRLVSLLTSASHQLCPSETAFTKDVQGLVFLQDALGWQLACRTHDNDVSFWTVPPKLFSIPVEGSEDDGDENDEVCVFCPVCNSKEVSVRDDEGTEELTPDKEGGPASDDEGKQEPAQERNSDSDEEDEQATDDEEQQEPEQERSLNNDEQDTRATDDEDEDDEEEASSLPHLISRYEGRVFDVHFRTSYTIRKDGWVCKTSWERRDDGDGDGDGDYDGDGDEDGEDAPMSMNVGVDVDENADDNKSVDEDWNGGAEVAAEENRDVDGGADADRDRDLSENATCDKDMDEDEDCRDDEEQDDIKEDAEERLFWLPQHLRPLYNNPQFSAFNGKMIILTHNWRVLFLTLPEDVRQ